MKSAGRKFNLNFNFFILKFRSFFVFKIRRTQIIDKYFQLWRRRNKPSIDGNNRLQRV